MEDILIKKRPVRISLPKTYEGLTVLVVAHSNSMQQKHPSGMTKTEMAERAINTLFEGMTHSLMRECESFARVESGTGLATDALESAFHIASAWRNQANEGVLRHHSQVILLTDGNDENKEKTRSVVENLDGNEIPLFIYHLPSEDNPTEGYDYCTSLAPTHSMYEVSSLSHVFCLDDMESSTIDKLFHTTKENSPLPRRL